MSDRRTVSEIMPNYRLPLPIDEWMALQNAVLREGERCESCGDYSDGYRWTGFGFVCRRCCH